MSDERKLDILKYLGYPKDAVPDEIVLGLIERSLGELDKQARFQYVYDHYAEPLDFMVQNDAYVEYLKGAEGFILCATTLGIQVDRYIKRIETVDMQYAVVFDATASVYLEEQADEYEKSLPFENKGFRFCPGYGGTPVTDSRAIADKLRAHKIGITFLESGLMVPMKSMAGIIRLGGESRKSCKGCVAAKGCPYLQQKTTCW